MASFVFTLLFLLVGGTPLAVSHSGCLDRGESSGGAVRVLEGEAGWLSCPLFSHPSIYNFTSAQSAGRTLTWYRIPQGHGLEQPVQYSWRISRDNERLWLQPANGNDTGLYICILSNSSSCSQMSVRLRVLPPDGAVRSSACEPAVAVATQSLNVPLQSGAVLDCPELQEAQRTSSGETRVTWSHLCGRTPLTLYREQKAERLQIHVMLGSFEGLYFCRVEFRRTGRLLHFTRSLNVSAVSPVTLSKLPTILLPGQDQVFTVQPNSEVSLLCRGSFPFLNSSWEIWWTVDGKTLDQLADQHRFSRTDRRERYVHGDRWEDSVLRIHDFQSEDLNREYNCSVRNGRGFETRRARLEQEGSLPSVELGCGLGVTLVLMLVLFVVYHVFWLELLLLYRSWFGTDERHTDEKQYDVYLSYARHSEEEHFVLFTLRSVLENQLKYSVCIFDRDSLPGGTITDETLGFVARSRRLLVVLSPGYASRGSQALLELQAGLEAMARGGHLRVILVQYRPVRWQAWVRELRRARVALVLVRWQGDKSKELTSRFWKRLRVELPVRRLSGEEVQEEAQEELGLMRMLSQNSTGSQTGLVRDTSKDQQMVLNSAA